MDKLKILVLGGNGFTGKFVCKELNKRKINFHCLIKENSDTKWLKKNNINFVLGNIDNTTDLINSLIGCNCVINTASLAYINIENLINCCQKKNVSRILCISSTSIFTKLNVNSKKIRIGAENKIISSNLKWTILRPTMIFGTPEDRNIIKIIDWIAKFPVIPIPGNGKALQRPVYVEDLSWAVVESILNERTIKKIIQISGKDYISYISIIESIEKKLEKNILKIYINKTISILISQFFELVKLKFPLKTEQIRRINEDKLFLSNDAIDIINYSPTNFDKVIDKEIKLYKKKSL